MELKARDFRAAAQCKLQGQCLTVVGPFFGYSILLGICWIVATICFFFCLFYVAAAMMGLWGHEPAYDALARAGAALGYMFVALAVAWPIFCVMSFHMSKAVLLVTKEQRARVNPFSEPRRLLRCFWLNVQLVFLSWLWGFLLVIPGIIKYCYSYSMSRFFLIDKPFLSASEARACSVRAMRGYKFKLFCLDASFLGWWILCIPTFGLLALWVAPYHMTARAEFYRMAERRGIPSSEQE